MDLANHICSCRKWQLTGISCNHVVSAIFAIDRMPAKFVDQCYKTTTQQAIYSHMIEPVRGPNQWTPYDTCLPILPPVLKRPLKRLKKIKIKKLMKEMITIKKLKRKG
ncbi:hypothetical protein HRI_002776800 [Hibiscus trionum]|uniref:SWIM-type domain-containing protein n=1 Tax=Hibiscus trionum TaxID=183268 RepID=A0A9W7IB66_HIBTR|nr:hypothetical protein HRI_002776800 [Hibiscus trionum]